MPQRNISWSSLPSPLQVSPPPKSDDVLVIQVGTELLDVDRIGRSTGGLFDVAAITIQGLVELGRIREMPVHLCGGQIEKLACKGRPAERENPAPRNRRRNPRSSPAGRPCEAIGDSLIALNTRSCRRTTCRIDDSSLQRSQ